MEMMDAIWLMGPLTLAAVCAYCSWRGKRYTKLLICVEVVFLVAVAAALWVRHDSRDYTPDAALGDTLFLTLALAPPVLSGLCIYYWGRRIAVPVSFFVIGVTPSWIIGFFIFVRVVVMGTLDEAHVYKALGVFLTVLVAILLLLLLLFRVRPPSKDSK
jgi:hypothetical protein